MRIRPIFWMLSVTFFFSLSPAAHSQTAHHPAAGTDITKAPADDQEAVDRLARDMAKKATLQRAAALKIDTDKLLKLAVELKAEVEKSNENVLSLDVIRKAEEIERLAHSVKDKMKGPG